MSVFDPYDFFKNPKTARQRQFDALRTYYLEGLTQREAAERSGYTLSSFQSLIRDFKKGKIVFFQEPKKGPKSRTTPNPVKTRIVSLRKKNLSIYDIHAVLKEEGMPAAIQTIDRILREEGFARLPRRSRRERRLTTKGALLPERSRRLDFTKVEGSFDCQVAGIYYLIPYMLKLGLHETIAESRLPSTNELSNVNNVFSILSLKLMGHKRLSTIGNYSFDRGLGFFAGLNVLPKPTTASTYTYKIDKGSVQGFQRDFVQSVRRVDEAYYSGRTINLDFHTIPHYGEEPSLEENWVAGMGKRMKGALTFFAQDGEYNMISYANADIRRQGAPGEILRFVDHWIGVKGVLDQTLVFDSRLTNYPMLRHLDGMGVKFITLRRRGEEMIKEALSTREGWETVKVDIPKRKHQTFKALEREAGISGMDLREIVIYEHGRLKPTFVISNNFDIPLEETVEWYARRWRVENKLSELVEFFNLNALGSPVMIRIHFDVMLTVVADTLYRMFADDLPGFENTSPATLFSKFIDTQGKVMVEGDDVVVRTAKKAHKPILKSLETFQESVEVPWWGNKTLKFE